MMFAKGVKLRLTAAPTPSAIALANDERQLGGRFRPAIPGAQFLFAYGSETGSIRLKKTDFARRPYSYDRLPTPPKCSPGASRQFLLRQPSHQYETVYDSADTLVRNVSFRQAAYNKVEVDFETESSGAIIFPTRVLPGPCRWTSAPAPRLRCPGPGR